MLNLDQGEVDAQAVSGRAFSNGFEWDNWSATWCGTCKHDDDFGGDGQCPLLGVALIGEATPAQWREVSLGGLANRYECESYEPRDGEEDARLGLPDRVTDEVEDDS